MARTLNLAWRYRWDRDPEACLNRSVELALRAVECDDLDPHAHAALGYAYLFRNEHAAALAAYERAVELNPNDPDILAEYSGALTYDTKPEQALEIFGGPGRVQEPQPLRKLCALRIYFQAALKGCEGLVVPVAVQLHHGQVEPGNRM